MGYSPVIEMGPRTEATPAQATGTGQSVDVRKELASALAVSTAVPTTLAREVTHLERATNAPTFSPEAHNRVESLLSPKAQVPTELARLECYKALSSDPNLQAVTVSIFNSLDSQGQANFTVMLEKQGRSGLLTQDSQGNTLLDHISSLVLGKNTKGEKAELDAAFNHASQKLSNQIVNSLIAVIGGLERPDQERTSLCSIGASNLIVMANPAQYAQKVRAGLENAQNISANPEAFRAAWNRLESAKSPASMLAMMVGAQDAQRRAQSNELGRGNLVAGVDTVTAGLTREGAGGYAVQHSLALGTALHFKANAMLRDPEARLKSEEAAELVHELNLRNSMGERVLVEMEWRQVATDQHAFHALVANKVEGGYVYLSHTAPLAAKASGLLCNVEILDQGRGYDIRIPVSDFKQYCTGMLVSVSGAAGVVTFDPSYTEIPGLLAQPERFVVDWSRGVTLNTNSALTNSDGFERDNLDPLADFYRTQRGQGGDTTDGLTETDSRIGARREEEGLASVDRNNLRLVRSSPWSSSDIELN